MASDIYLNFDSNFYDKYAIHSNFLDRGAYGTVYGPIPWHGLQLALKQAMFADGKVTAEFKRRIEEKKVIWSSLVHRHLTRIHSVDLNQLPKAMYIVMEFAAGGSLRKTLRTLGTENKLPIDVVTDWAKQIAEGLHYLHVKNIIHRDLKTSNILLMKHFDVLNPHTMMTLKITDFDEVKEYDHTTTMSFVGTVAYMAPEVTKNQWFSKASDVWSYGVVIWEMLSGDIPHKGLESRTILMKSQTGELDDLSLGPSFPDAHKSLLTKCWNSSYAERPSMHEILLTLRRMELLPEKCKSDPISVKRIRTKAGEEEKKWINGLTILDKEVFVVSGRSSIVEVYDSTELSLNRKLNLNALGLIEPMDIGSCDVNKCIYVFDYKVQGQMKEILRFDPYGNLIRNWSTGFDEGRGLSVAEDSNVILTLSEKNKLNEYSSDGQLIREIDLSSNAGIHSPWHAIKLTNDEFVVCHGFLHDALRGVGIRIVNAEGKLMKSFSGKFGSQLRAINEPIYLSVDENGFVMIADRENSRVVLLDWNLEFKRDILSADKHGLQRPFRILLDATTGRMFVAEDRPDTAGLIVAFQF